MLDLPEVPHTKVHQNHSEYCQCSEPQISTYVDDSFSIIQGTRENIWQKIKKICTENGKILIGLIKSIKAKQIKNFKAKQLKDVKLGLDKSNDLLVLNIIMLRAQ